MATISKPAGGAFTVSGSLKNVGTIDLNIWTRVHLKGPNEYMYPMSTKIPIPIGQTKAFLTTTNIIPPVAPLGNYNVLIDVGDNTAPFQGVDTGWIITVTAPIKQCEAVGVTVS